MDENQLQKLSEELASLKKYIKELENKIAQNEIQLNRQDSSEKILLELLKEKNQKQSEVDELLAKLLDKDEEMINYKAMYEDYKEAADDRLERLQFYEGSKLAKILCSFNIRMKKKSVNEKAKIELFREKYYSLYSEEEKKRFEFCKEQIDIVKYRPLISMVIPVYNTDLHMLDELIMSMQEQSYTNWEMCFANGSHENERLNQALSAYASEDSRIHYKILDKNGGISYNTNQAFEMSQGEFIGMLDHDDLLTPNALAEIIIVLNENKELDFIYSDQDKINEETTSRFGILHKPAWSMETLYSGNYITHFSVIRKSIIHEIGEWDSNVDGAQDWDLFLKVAEKTQKIFAIPQVLYHWRTAATSTALSMDTKEYAMDAQICSLQNHLERMGYPAKAYFSNKKKLEIHIQWDNLSDQQISIIIFDEKINDNLNSYIQFMWLELKEKLKEVVLISEDKERLESVSQECRKIHKRCNNYAEAYNLGADCSTGEILICATDRAVSVDVRTYEELAQWARHPEIGVVGPKALYGNRKVNSMGIILNKDMPRSLFHKYDNLSAVATPFGNTSWYRNVNAIDYYCFAVERSKFQKIGGFKPELERVAIIEYCLRSRKKYRNLVNPFAVVQYNVNYPKDVMLNCNKAYIKLLEKYNMPEIDAYYNPQFYEIEKQTKRRVVVWK